MTAHRVPKFWDLVESALAVDGARAIHLSVGRPPLVRVGDEGLRPLDDAHQVLTWKDITVLLSYVVEPEQWDGFEAIGDGEVRVLGGIGRSIRVNIFRSSEAWSAVVHL